MSTPHLSVLPGPASASALASESPAQPGATQLHLPGPVQVHIHLGPAAVPENRAAGPQLRSPVLLALLGLSLAGGGYWAGSRDAAPPVRVDAAGLLAGDPAPGLGLPPAMPAVPAAPSDIPQALRQQLARPPVVTPAPGTPGVAGMAAGPGGAASGAGRPPAPGASGPPTPGGAPAPARNPFGLGN